MKVNDLKREGNTISFVVEEEYSALDPYVDKQFVKHNKTARIPGFRPGKAPKAIFFNHYGYERLAYDALLDMLNDKYPQIVAEQKLDVIDYPKDIDIIQMEKGKPIQVALKVDVKPEVKVKNYKGIKLEKESTKVTKEDIDAETTKFLDAHSTYEEDADAMIRKDDQAILDIEATVDGVVIDRLTKTDDVIKVGTNTIAKAFDDALQGLRTGQSKEFTVDYSKEENAHKDVEGKKVVFRISVKKVRIKKVPKIDDAFVAEKTEFKTVEAYKKDLEEKLTKTKESSADNKLKEDVVKWLIENINADIPEVMIQKESEYLIRRMDMNLRQYNLNLDQYLNVTQKSKEDLKKDYEDEAAKNVRYTLSLDYIAQEENVAVTDADVTAEIETILSQETGTQDKDQIRKQLEGMSDSIKENLKYRKVVDFLLEHAKIKKK